MEIDGETPNSSFTILRIKRKRTDEPLDALVVESRVRRKKSRGVGVFQFAKTVEDGVWRDDKWEKDIQEQVSRLARESSEVKPRIVDTEVIPPSISRQKDDSRRYTVLKRGDPDVDTRRRTLPTSPPKVISSKDLPPKTVNSDIKMYDAVLEADKPPSGLTTMDPEMEKFLPLLQDYLKLNDADPKAGSAVSSGAPGASDDYVWDVFYHRPLTLSEWNEAANVGTLSGLPPSITNAYDSASDSDEAEDEADEDSNAEEYYKNDYPDEDSEEYGSDLFHEESDHDDIIRYDEQGSDYDWR